jgi:ribosomal protein S18 acetylase RimI-like enzyme
MNISPATRKDIPALVSLINSAYRGQASKKGWTTEADLLQGEIRTDIDTLKETLEQAGTAMLKYTEGAGAITGCVFLQVMERGLYLGMLTVSPERQSGGIGKKLLEAATAHAKHSGCTNIYMSVISVRHELIAWYERQGFHLTGETKPFPENNRFGLPTQPLFFAIMQKNIE